MSDSNPLHRQSLKLSSKLTRRRTEVLQQRLKPSSEKSMEDQKEAGYQLPVPNRLAVEQTLNEPHPPVEQTKPSTVREEEKNPEEAKPQQALRARSERMARLRRLDPKKTPQILHHASKPITAADTTPTEAPKQMTESTNDATESRDPFSGVRRTLYSRKEDLKETSSNPDLSKFSLRERKRALMAKRLKDQQLRKEIAPQPQPTPARAVSEPRRRITERKAKAKELVMKRKIGVKSITDSFEPKMKSAAAANDSQEMVSRLSTTMQPDDNPQLVATAHSDEEDEAVSIGRSVASEDTRSIDRTLASREKSSESEGDESSDEEEEPLKRPAIPKPVVKKVESPKPDLMVNTAWDFRPLDTDNSSAKIDASWDPNQVLFNEFDKGESKKSWVYDLGSSITNDEKVEITEAVQDDNLDPLGWPRSPAGLTTSRDEESSSEEETDSSEEDSEDEEDDAENLLGHPSRSEEVGSEGDEGSSDDDDYDEEASTPLSKEQRVEAYESLAKDGESSSEESQDDDSEDDDDDIEIGYISQTTTESDELEDEIPVVAPSLRNRPVTEQSSVFTFGTNSINGESSGPTDEGGPQIPSDPSSSIEDSLLASTVFGEGISASMSIKSGEDPMPGGILVPPPPPPPPPRTDMKLLIGPPPPPPPGQKKKKKRRQDGSRNGTGESYSAPLIAPPPEEKLREWENSKTKQFLDGKTNTASLLVEESRSSESFSEEKYTDSPLERQAASSEELGDCDREVTSNSSSFNSCHSPASSNLILHDSRLAEKIDTAIGAASETFEEQQSPKHGDSHVVEVGAESENDSPEKVSHSQRNGMARVVPGCTFGTFSANSVDQSMQNASAEVQKQLDGISNLDTVFKDATEENEKTDEKNGRHHRGKHKGRRKDTKNASNAPTRRFILPEVGPSPFVAAVANDSSLISTILSFLGDPVAVCRLKMTSRAFRDYVYSNEHTLMRDAVRLGGMTMNVRPYFWLWITLEKGYTTNRKEGRRMHSSDRDLLHAQALHDNELLALEEEGRNGKWHHVIERDVSRAFGNLPPHKTGARLRTDSIVRALVSWGRSSVLKRGVKGISDAFVACDSKDSDDVSLSPTDTVSDWGGVTPAGSFNGSFTSSNSTDNQNGDDRKPPGTRKTSKSRPEEELALSGNTLTPETKVELQGRLSFILHALASAHGDVGYCQGMDYVVSHLLRILQDTIRWMAVNGMLPACIKGVPERLITSLADGEDISQAYSKVDKSLVVEETIFRVVDCFFTTYGLQHFYWPELRCLKTCCRVFEKLIKIKLPVLADHFEHHDFSVGLFALGWFQTLFLYLPSMPSATVCHIWDIWLVERSFKIFFRVATAILFLSQPILLNHELEGMMSYLNTFPDATLLSPDILIACALQIKVTNRMLMELEQEVKEDSPY